MMVNFACQGKLRWRLVAILTVFTDPLEPDTSKTKTHLTVPLFFQGECDSQQFDARS